MVTWTIGTALAARVVCTPELAVRTLDEARIDETRVPETHPELVPGLARRAAPDSPLAVVLERLCATGDDLGVQRGETWSGPRHAAYEIVVSRASTVDCTLHQERVVVSVVTGDDGITYRLLDRPPPDITPGPDCPTEPEWRQTTPLDRAGPVRLRLVRDRRGRAGAVTGSRIEVWWASDRGWSRQTLADPAPSRHLRPDGGGPWFQLGRTTTGETFVVASLDRTPPPCRSRPGQTVWTRRARRWRAARGRNALAQLARAGLWPLAGDDGWLLIVAQDEETDRALLDVRRRRLRRRFPEPLYVFRSADFPNLNPGYLAIAPGPWATREQAEAFLAERPRRGAYVKQAWAARDGCAVDPVAGD